MKVRKVSKKQIFSIEDSIRYQLITELVFFKKLILTPAELEILIQLVLAEEIELGQFCTETTKKIYAIEKMEDFAVKSQNVRNIINKLHKKGVVTKTVGNGKRLIVLNPAVEVFWKGNVLIDYNFLSKENEPNQES